MDEEAAGEEGSTGEKEKSGPEGTEASAGERSFWSYYGIIYDTVRYLEPYQAMLHDVASAIHCKPGLHILNAGCGTGNLEKELYARSADLTIESVDFSPVMLARARSKNLKGSPTFRQIDLNSPLPYPDCTFDVVSSVNCIYALPRPDFTLQEIGRVLKPGGRVVISDPGLGASPLRIFRQHLRRSSTDSLGAWLGRLASTGVLLPAMIAVGIINARIVKEATKGAYTFRSSDEWRKRLEQVGFQDVKTTATYAGQNILAQAVNPPSDRRRGNAGIDPGRTPAAAESLSQQSE